MAITIPTNTGAKTDDAINAQDKFFSLAQLPDTTTLDSSAFKFGGSQGGVELRIFADVEIVVAASQTITFDLYTSATEDGSYTLHKQIVQLPAATYAAGDQLAIEMPERDVAQWAKVRVTTTATQASDTITGYVRQVER